MRKEKNLDHQVDILNTLIRQDENETKKHAKAEQLRRKIEQEEKERQEKQGIVLKPANVGRFKYKMKKTDFQLEDELAPSLRQLKALGTDDLLRDRFDSVFRRNMIELDAPTEAEKKRQRKLKYKYRERQGAAYGGTLAAKLARKNDKQKRKLNESKSFLKDDLIMI